MYREQKKFDDLEFTKIPELKPENWRRLSETERVYVLQKCSDAICKYENRPKDFVTAYDFESSNRNAIYIPDSNEIKISRKIIAEPTPYRAFEMLVHESMHGYTWHAVHNKGFHKNETDVKEWKEGIKNYEQDSKNDFSYNTNEVETPSKNIGKLFAGWLEKEDKEQRQTQGQTPPSEIPSTTSWAKEEEKQLLGNKKNVIDITIKYILTSPDYNLEAKADNLAIHLKDGEASVINKKTEEEIHARPVDYKGLPVTIYSKYDPEKNNFQLTLNNIDRENKLAPNLLEVAAITGQIEADKLSKLNRSNQTSTTRWTNEQDKQLLKHTGTEKVIKDLLNKDEVKAEAQKNVLVIELKNGEALVRNKETREEIYKCKIPANTSPVKIATKYSPQKDEFQVVLNTKDRENFKEIAPDKSLSSAEERIKNRKRGHSR